MGMGFFVSLSRIEHIVSRELFIQGFLFLCVTCFCPAHRSYVNLASFLSVVESMNYFDTSMLAGFNILTNHSAPNMYIPVRTEVAPALNLVVSCLCRPIVGPKQQFTGR